MRETNTLLGSLLFESGGMSHRAVLGKVLVRKVEQNETDSTKISPRFSDGQNCVFGASGSSVCFLVARNKTIVHFFLLLASFLVLNLHDYLKSSSSLSWKPEESSIFAASFDTDLVFFFLLGVNQSSSSSSFFWFLKTSACVSLFVV